MFDIGHAVQLQWKFIEMTRNPMAPGCNS